MEWLSRSGHGCFNLTDWSIISPKSERRKVQKLFYFSVYGEKYKMNHCITFYDAKIRTKVEKNFTILQIKFNNGTNAHTQVKLHVIKILLCLLYIFVLKKNNWIAGIIKCPNSCCFYVQKLDSLNKNIFQKQNKICFARHFM